MPPGKGPLDLQPVPPKTGAARDATPGDAWDDAASAAGSAAEAVIVALVGVQQVMTAARHGRCAYLNDFCQVLLTDMLVKLCVETMGAAKLIGV